MTVRALCFFDIAPRAECIPRAEYTPRVECVLRAEFARRRTSVTVPQTSEHTDFWRFISACTASDIDELVEEERRTRAARVQKAFEDGARADTSGVPNHAAFVDQRLFDRMSIGENLAAVNEELRGDLSKDLDLTKARKTDPSVTPAYDLYNLTRNTRLIAFYYHFGDPDRRGSEPRQRKQPRTAAIAHAGSDHAGGKQAGRDHAGRLEPETEALLLELLWWRTLEKNDIAIARRSVWWVAGSENHDLNTKVTNTLTSAIFAAHPDYADRVYPNQGHGCAPGYMSAGYSEPAIADPSRTGHGRASWSDGKEYRPADHLDAWISFLTEYLAERARKGFFLENGSPGYMRYTIGYLLLLYNFCPDPALKEQTKMFLDLVWADWAIQQIGGLRGGPKTRHHHDAGKYDAMSDWARFYLGGQGTTTAIHTQQLIGDYELSRTHWELVVDRAGLGSFAYVSRGIGEEETTCPRPSGVERTMIGEVESRFVKYAWITPDYILGTQMDHPLAVHNHLSASGRWQGLVTEDVNARVATVSLRLFPGKTRPGNDYSIEQMYHSVQSKQVLITQQKRRWTQINPDWFPAYEDILDVEFGVFVGTGWETREERDGWVFLQHKGTFAAIRILRLKSDPDPMAFAKGTDRYRLSTELEQESYSWNESQTVLRLINRYSPVIIEAGRGADYGCLDEFADQILANKLEVHKTVNTQETRFVIVYKGIEAEEIVFNGANPIDVPTIGGKKLDYSYPKTFDAPYLQSAYDSGVVEFTKSGRRITMDFNDVQ